MFYFRITKRQRQLLKDIIEKTNVTFKYSFSSSYFALEKQTDIEKCFDFLLEYFVYNGLQKNDEPSEYGIEIENINEKINHQLALNNSEIEFSEKHPVIYSQAKKIFIECKGNIDKLDVETQKIYKKLNIPIWLKENWLIQINNLDIEQHLLNN